MSTSNNGHARMRTAKRLFAIYFLIESPMTFKQVVQEYRSIEHVSEENTETLP